MHPKFLISALGITLLTSNSHATQLDPIKVTSQENHPYPEQGNSESGSILRQFSGVDAQRLGGHGLDILIRGQGQSAVNILIDQGKIEGACPNRMDSPTAYAELTSFNKITLIKGVKSLQYGAGGTAGTLLLERTKPEFTSEKPYQGTISAATNSNGLDKDLGAQVSAGNDQAYLTLQATDKTASHYQDGQGNKVKSAYKTQQGHLDLGWTPNEHHHLRFSHEISNTKDAHYQGAGMDAPKSDGTMTRLNYQSTDITPAINQLSFNIYHSEVKHLMDNYSLRPAGMMQMQTPSKVTTQGAKLKLTSYLGEAEIDYGLLLQKTQKNATLLNRAGESQWHMWPDAQTQQNSIFIEATSPLTAKQTLIYGVRLDKVNAKAKNANQGTQAGANRTAHDSYTQANANYSGKTQLNETNWNGLIRLEQQLTHQLLTFIGLSHTQRTADETERFMARTNWTGNPDLKPEKHTQADLGISQTTPTHSWSANIYYDKINDFILRDQAANQTQLTHSGDGYLNIDAKIYGAELDWNIPYKNWTLSGNLAITQGKNTSNNRDLPNMSPLNGSLNARYDSTNWYATTQLNFATEQNKIDQLNQEEKSPSWHSLNLSAGYQITQDFIIQAGIENLLDKEYFTHVNRQDPTTGNLYKVNEPGRNLWAKVQYDF